MAQRTLGRVLATVALTATLTLALPVHADAAPLRKPASLWEWVGGFLEEKIAAVWGRPGGRKQPTAAKPAPAKQGGCIDPNGCATGVHFPAAPQKPICAEWSEQGGCIDPNG